MGRGDDHAATEGFSVCIDQPHARFTVQAFMNRFCLFVRLGLGRKHRAKLVSVPANGEDVIQLDVAKFIVPHPDESSLCNQ